MNVALADPARVSFDEISGYLVGAESGNRVVSTLMGTATYYCNSKWTIRSVSITPFAQGWHRFTAVLGRVSQQRVLYFWTWRKGALFSATPFRSGKSVTQELGATAISGPELRPMEEGRSSVESGQPGRGTELDISSGFRWPNWLLSGRILETALSRRGCKRIHFDVVVHGEKGEDREGTASGGGYAPPQIWNALNHARDCGIG